MSKDRREKRKLPRSYFNPKPVKVGEELDVTISDKSRRGDGIVRIGGYVVFVPNTEPGDQVRIKISKIRPGYAVAEKIS